MSERIEIKSPRERQLVDQTTQACMFRAGFEVIGALGINGEGMSWADILVHVGKIAAVVRDECDCPHPKP